MAAKNNRNHSAPGDGSETLLAPSEPMQAEGHRRTESMPPARIRETRPAPRGGLLERMAESRRAPFLRLIGYYVLLIGIMGALVYWVPMVRDAFISPVVLPDLGRGGSGSELLTRAPTLGDYGARLSLGEALHRALTTLLVIAGRCRW
jgi:hypothetical protein